MTARQPQARSKRRAPEAEPIAPPAIGADDLGAETFAVTLDDLAPAVRLREIALRLFAQHGVAATSIRMVATAAGVSPGGVLHHYKSKEDLESAVLEAALRRLRGAINGVGLDRPTLEALNARRDAHEAFLAAEPVIGSYLRNVYLGGGPAAARVFEALNALRREQMEQMIAAGLARPMPDPEVGMMLYGILGLSSLILRPLLERSEELDENDPATRARFRAAEIDLLTRPLFIE
jgi:AcrR family transcriptional regulator